MIEILEYKPSQKESSFKGTFSIKITEWNLVIRNLSHVKTDRAEFVKFPQKMKLVDDKWEKEFSYVDFTDKNVSDSFNKGCIKAINDHLSKLQNDKARQDDWMEF